MQRIIIVSNRLPVSIIKRADDVQYIPSPGGLASGLSSLSKSYEFLWIGWPGIKSEALTTNDKIKIAIKLTQEQNHPIFLSEKEVENYYEGFSNKTIWPLFHYFPLYTIYENHYWQTYKQVNQIFCDEIAKVAEPEDYIWIHDYQLMLVPHMLRQKMPNIGIGFFLHIPFPSFELFRSLPWRRDILNGLLGADVIGFHTYDYVRHFLSSASRISGLEHNLGVLNVGSRVVKIDAFPLGIDYEKYSQAPKDADVQKEIRKIRQKVGERKIIISIDRLDYTKGIIERLEAFDLFLSQNPEYKGKVTLIMVAVPSRTKVKDYKTLREELEHLVGRINGEHGLIGWMPVWYLYRFLPFRELTALYRIADVALVTPLRDGMNLISKEFIATKTDGRGVLILSEMAGAASELAEAITVNANNKSEIVQAIKDALEMPVEEQVERNRLMQNRLSSYTASRWADDFLHALSEIKKTQQKLSVRKLTETIKHTLIDEYRKSKRRLLLLDYDGTLVGFQGRPEKAGPDEEIIALLEDLSGDHKNEVVIISGRDKNTLTKWLGNLNVTLIAEHGGWIKRQNQEWECMEPLKDDWKATIRPILELSSDRTPGASIEEKDFSLVWHCRRADPELARVRTQELRDTLMNLTSNLGVGVFEGSKILEVKSHDINKGKIAELLLEKGNWDFILAAGDDYTDEEMFAVLPSKAYSIRVGTCVSRARFNVDSVSEIRELLKELLGDLYAKPRKFSRDSTG